MGYAFRTEERELCPVSIQNAVEANVDKIMKTKSKDNIDTEIVDDDDDDEIVDSEEDIEE